MKRNAVPILLIVAASTSVGSAPIEDSASPPAYRFDEVRSRVTLRHAGRESKVKEGAGASVGDEVETGWFGRAVLTVPARGSRFELFASTKVLLGGPEEGILVRLEKGRLRAIFEKLVGSDDRLVSTPGALLAVRGTRYGLEVDGSGDATLVVFEGSVEVRPRAAGLEAIPVAPGELCLIRRDSMSRRSKMPRGMTEETWMNQGASHRGRDDHGRHGDMPSGESHRGRGGGTGGHGGH